MHVRGVQEETVGAKNRRVHIIIYYYAVRETLQSLSRARIARNASVAAATLQRGKMLAIKHRTSRVGMYYNIMMMIIIIIMIIL